MASTNIPSGGTAARRVGAAAGLVGITVAAAPSTSIVEAGDLEQPFCIDLIGDSANDDSDTWDLTAWDAFLSTCQADFGFGKVIIDVVTSDAEPLPAEVDLDAITRALEFGYADAARDAQRLRFDPYCELEWEQRGGEDDYLLVTDGYTDFRRDDTVPGPEKLLLELRGDVDPLDGPGATDFGLDEDEVLLTHFCLIADADQLRQNPIADVGGGYQLPEGVNPSHTRGNFDAFSSTPASIEVIVTPMPPPTTTTTTTTTTTVPETTTTAPATTTTAAPTTTTPPAVAAPSTTIAPAIGPTLPATGNRNGLMALVATALLALGGATAAVSRRRPAER